MCDGLRNMLLHDDSYNDDFVIAQIWECVVSAGLCYKSVVVKCTMIHSFPPCVCHMSKNAENSYFVASNKYVSGCNKRCLCSYVFRP